jgi:hypothetical protein
MLPSGAADYTPSQVVRWLSLDPSLPVTIVLMIIVYLLGNRLRAIRLLAAPVFISFLPLSLWIWDIPFTGRYICNHFHDDRLMIMDGFPVKTRYFYLIGLAVYLSFTAHLIRSKSQTGSPDGAL